MRRQKIKVLVVDTDLLFLRLLTYNLQLEGYDVWAVCDGQRAIEEVERYAPDLVLLDVTPHQRDALTVCQRIRERSQAPIVRIAAVRVAEKHGQIDLGPTGNI